MLKMIGDFQRDTEDVVLVLGLCLNCSSLKENLMRNFLSDILKSPPGGNFRQTWKTNRDFQKRNSRGASRTSPVFELL